MRAKSHLHPSAIAVLRGSSDDSGLSAEQEASLQWPAVAARAAGNRNGPPLNEISEAVVRNMGGFGQLGRMNAQEFQIWGRREFERIYSTIAEKRELDRVQIGEGEPMKRLEAHVGDGSDGASEGDGGNHV